MNFWTNIRYSILLRKTPNSEQFQNGLTPENALERLREFNDNPKVIEAAQIVEPPAREWFLNSFQFASYAIDTKDIVAMALYINTSQVFEMTAPHYYGSTTWNHVVSNMISRSQALDRRQLLGVLEDRGHMQGIVGAIRLGGSEMARIYFDHFSEGLSVEDAKRFLKNSPSFRIAVNNPLVAEVVLDGYPQFKELLDLQT